MIISQNGDGPIILAVKDSRLAIGRGLLHHIQVELKESLTHQTESHDSPALTFQHIKNGKHRCFRYRHGGQ